MKRKLVRAVTVRPQGPYFEGGKVTPRLEKLANELLARRSKVYRTPARAGLLQIAERAERRRADLSTRSPASAPAP